MTHVARPSAKLDFFRRMIAVGLCKGCEILPAKTQGYCSNVCRDESERAKSGMSREQWQADEYAGSNYA